MSIFKYKHTSCDFSLSTVTKSKDLFQNPTGPLTVASEAYLCSVSLPIECPIPCPDAVLNSTRFFICFGPHRSGCFLACARGGTVTHVAPASICLALFCSPLWVLWPSLTLCLFSPIWPGRRPGCLMEFVFHGHWDLGCQEAALSVGW